MMHKGNKPFDEDEIVERILTNVYRDDECLLWAGSKGPQGRPRIYWRGKYYSAQRLLIKLTRKGQYRAKQCIQVTCGNQACVNPEHLTMTPAGIVLRRAYEAGRRASPLHIAIGRAKNARLGIDKARDVWAMRAQGQTLKQIGDQYGVTLAAVHHAIKTWQRMGVI